MVTICRLTPKHAKAAFELRLAGLREAPSAFGSSYEEEKDIALAVIEERLVEMPDRGYFGAFAGEQLVGVVVLGRESLRKLSHKALIWGMVVAPQARGKGVGRALLQAAIAFARSVPGIRQVNLSVNAENTAAIRLYQSLGFEAFGRERSSICVDGQMHDEIHMALHWIPHLGDT